MWQSCEAERRVDIEDWLKSVKVVSIKKKKKKKIRLFGTIGNIDQNPNVRQDWRTYLLHLVDRIDCLVSQFEKGFPSYPIQLYAFFVVHLKNPPPRSSFSMTPRH